MKIPDLNDATLIYANKGVQKKQRINTNATAFNYDDDGVFVSVSAGVVALEKITSDALGDNVQVLLSNALKRRGINQSYQSLLRYLIDTDERIRSFYNLKYEGDDSLSEIAKMNICDGEVLAYHILHGKRPVFKLIEITADIFLRIEKDKIRP